MKKAHAYALELRIKDPLDGPNITQIRLVAASFQDVYDYGMKEICERQAYCNCGYRITRDV